MTFSITLDDGSIGSSGVAIASGVLLLNGVTEHFRAPLHFWTPQQYRSQWRMALQHVLSGAGTAALITSMPDPSKANFITWWPLYVDGDLIRIQNHILFLEQIEGPFDLEHPYVHVPERKTVDEDGDAISEWTVSRASVVTFLEAFDTFRP